MGKIKAKFKKGQKFFHAGQNLFVEIEDLEFFEGKGWLYTLKTYSHKNEVSPFKRYYEPKVIEMLAPMRETPAVKILYGK